MKIYKPKALISGHKLGPEYAGKKYVAVPKQKVERGYYVAYGNNLMATLGKEPDMRLRFEDRYGRGSYWLYYYEWVEKKLVMCDLIA